MTGGPCLKCTELIVDSEFIHAYKSIKKNPSLFEKRAGDMNKQLTEEETQRPITMY